MNNSFWSEVVKATVSLFVLLLSVGVPFVGRWIDRHLSLKQVQVAKDLAHIAVSATEKMAGVSGMTSQQKYDAARHFLNDLANAHHIALDESQFKPLIESAVNWIDSFTASPLQSGVLSSEPALSIEQMVEDKIGEALQKVVWHPEVPVKIAAPRT